MSTYDPYDPPARPRYDDRRDRYGDARETRESTYTKAPATSRELVPRHREENELTVERTYPGGYSPRDARRARSAEPDYYEDDYDRDRHHSSRARRGRKGYADSYYESEEKRRRRVLSRQEKIIAAVAGAALALGGKEVYDRRTAATSENHEIQRNYVHSAVLGAAGAAAGYQGAGFYNKHSAKSDTKKNALAHRGRDRRYRDEYEYDSDSEDDAPAKKSHKKFLESALGVTSLGAAMKALTGGGKDDGTSHRGRSRSRSSTRSTKSRAHSMSKIQKGAMAALLAGATEAFRIAKEPGSFKGEKAKRVVTAALGAGAIGGAHDDQHNKRDIAQSVIGGLLGNRVIHGSKKNIEEDSRTGRSRSRSRFRSRSESGGGGGGGGLAALASAGLAAFGAKKVADSKDDSRGRSGSPDRRNRSRSRSVVDTARRGLARLGFGSEPDDGSRRDVASDYGDSHRVSRRHRGYSDESAEDEYRRDRRRRYDDDDDDDDDDDQPYRPRRTGRGKSDPGSDTDLGDSEDDERRARKLRGKQIITTGLATIASIHAAHGVYQSMGKQRARQKAVKRGTMTAQQATKLLSNTMLQDAAAVGLAALGVKGALSELKEAKEMSHECKNFQAEKRVRHERRVERQRKKSRAGYQRRRVDNWASPYAPQPARDQSVRRGGDSYAETLPPSPQ